MTHLDIDQLLKLPPEEKLRLLELLWESLSATPAAVPIGDAHRAAIEEAPVEHRQSPDEVLSFDQVLSEVRARR